MKHQKSPELKPLLAERLKLLMPDEKDFNNFLEIIKQPAQNSIRCNTLKISPNELIKRLKSKGWIIHQHFSDYPELMVIKNNLAPGELGRSLEHLLGYYYVQEIASMLPILALKPKPGEKILDLAAAPGSKTTQIAAKMNNTGLIIANDVSIGRISILATNLERCGISNTIITRKQGFELCKKLKQQNFLFDKILLDAPCSGEGTLRSSQATAKMWNIQSVKNLSNIQKSLIASAIELLKPNGEIVYSTCTHAPEENEEVLDFVLKKFNNIRVETINLPVKCRQGLTYWNNKNYDKSIEKSCRIYPQDNDTEGFFVAKLRRIK
jgi:NOL1/NOP2/sun family putative RNA methylase